MSDMTAAAESCFQVDVIRDLPFVAETLDGVTFWDAECSGHKDSDIDTGELYARLTIKVAKQLDMPLLIAMVIRDMTRVGRFSGLEAGFLAVVASAARVGSNH